jgi:hypothetical protein
MSPILGLHRHESQAVRGEPNIGEPQGWRRRTATAPLPIREASSETVAPSHGHLFLR